MGIYEFTILNLNERASLLWEKGHFLDNYSSGHELANLYQLSDFYVEVVISGEELRIVDIIAFKQGARLEKYLTKIRL